MSKHTTEQPQDHLTTIYGLVDPITGYVRYVGKSVNPKKRLQAHLTPNLLKGKSHKNHWIRNLLGVGKKPELIFLESVRDSDWEDAECRWIAYYRNIPNYPTLTNGTSGGDGVDKGTSPSEETRKKLSAAHKGRKLPPFTEKHRQNLSEATKKAWDNFSEEEKQRRIYILSLYPKPKKERLPKIKKTHRVYPDKDKCHSKFRGVTFYKVGKPWHSFCSIAGKLKHLGCFAIEEDAARAFDRFVIANGIVDAQTNFPRADYD